MSEFLLPLSPKQAGAMWLFLVVAFVIAGNFQRLLSRRNLVLALLLLPALPQVDIMLWEGHLGDPVRGGYLRTAFAVLFSATAFMGAWALSLAYGRRDTPATFNLGRRALGALLGGLVLMNLVVVLARKPEDSGPFTSLGAKRWVETGVLPYGDVRLRGPRSPGFGAAATYGPVLIAAHVPFLVLTGAEWTAPEVRPKSDEYTWPPLMATRLTCFFLHLIGLYSLFAIGRRLASTEAGLAMASLYAASPYVIGLGSDSALSSGLTFISHIAPAALTLLAFLALRRPFTCGALLAVAAGTLYYPAFFFPALLGWYFWRREGAARFTGGFAVAGLAIALLVIVFTPAIGDDGPVRLFFESTLEHQEGVDRREYGQSMFSFWGTQPELAAFFQKPLTGGTSLFKPTFLMYASFSLGAFFLARGRDERRMAFILAALGAGVQLWKTHASGTYVTWYMPFILIGLFGVARAPEPEPDEQLGDGTGGDTRPR